MPNYRRANLAGGTYFFTVNTLQRIPVLTEAPVREALREALRHTRLSAPFDIDAWVLLPDHLHCIWTLPPGDADSSMPWSNIKRYVSQRCGEAHGIENISSSRIKRHESGLWQTGSGLAITHKLDYTSPLFFLLNFWQRFCATPSHSPTALADFSRSL